MDTSAFFFLLLDVCFVGEPVEFLICDFMKFQAVSVCKRPTLLRSQVLLFERIRKIWILTAEFWEIGSGWIKGKIIIIEWRTVLFIIHVHLWRTWSTTAELKHIVSVFLQSFAVCDLVQGKGQERSGWVTLETPLVYFRPVFLGFVFLALALFLHDLDKVELKTQLSLLLLC